MVECIGCLPYVVLVGLEEGIHHWHVWFVDWLAVGVVVGVFPIGPWWDLYLQ